MKYDVSVIVPFFNNEPFLEEAITSVLTQRTTNLKIELILVNDCSTDNSLKIAKKYEGVDGVIIIDKNKNNGVSAARNDGIKKANGKYVMLLDGDDFLSKDTISKLFMFFEKYNNQIDLVTYPLYLKKGNNAPKIHSKYEIYDKGTNVYSIEEYPYINQTTINVIFKNDKKNFFDETLRLAEDQKFVTSIIMNQKRIGYCEEAQYIYRRYGGGVSQVYNNFYYCYDDIMKYNNWLIDSYKHNDKIPQYIQGMILNTLNWRLNNDMLFPYYLKGKDYEKSTKAILDLLQYIDINYIYNYPKMSLSNKIYFLKQKGSNLKLETKNEFINFVVDNTDLDNLNQFNIKVKRNKIIKNTLYFRALLEEAIWDIKKPKVYLIVKRKSTLEKTELNLFESTISKNKSRVKINSVYGFEISIDLHDVEYFYFELTLYNTNFILGSSHAKFASAKKISKNYIINYRKSYNKYFVKKGNLKNKVRYFAASILKEFNKSFKLQLYKLFSFIVPHKSIWLYCDKDKLDNAYFQFIYDINKKDGIKRYYVCSSNLIMNIDKKYYNNIIVFNSRKHKWLFLKADKVLTSIPSLEDYLPFEKNNKIKDILNYSLIYLPQDIIHVDSSTLYNKENNEVDKIVVSSKFEEKNLITNYGYFKEDFICSGVARYDLINRNQKPKNKILLAISFRSYLMFQNKINITFFQNSNFYKNINALFNDSNFLNFLEENNMNLDVKFDDEFECYNECFKIETDRINIKNGKINLSEYNMMVTDFSPLQFDFINLMRPIVYFIPDINEFEAGLHLFREIDLDEKENFGITCTSTAELIAQIVLLLKDNFVVQNKYKNRMKKFFLYNNKCREETYNSVNNSDG